MTKINELRALAAAARSSVLTADLPQRRVMLEASAERWEQMLLLCVETEMRAVVNDEHNRVAQIERRRTGEPERGRFHHRRQLVPSAAIAGRN